MKANEAPEKIHIQPNAHDRWFEGNIPNGLPNGLFVEYTRTDAFIEKATLWLTENASDYCLLHNSYDTKELVEDFITAMKRD